MYLTPVTSWTAAAIARRSAPIVITLAITISSTAGVAERAPYMVRSSVARSVLVTFATFADICCTTMSIGVARNSSQFCAYPAVAPTIEYVAMPAGSLSAPPLMTPGPTILAMSAALRCSRAISRAVARFAAVFRRAISDTPGRLRWDGQRPAGPRLLLEQTAERERGDLIDTHHEDRLTEIDASLDVLDMLAGQEAAQPPCIRPVDDCLTSRRNAVVLEHELAPQLSSGAVGE